MESKLNTRNSGPMDKFVMVCDRPTTSPGSTLPLAQLQPGSAAVPRNPLDKKEEEPHATHSFEWHWGEKKPITLTCNKAGTVGDLLQRSSLFTQIAKKNKNKELVIVRDGKAISSHFPCSLIMNEHLTVKYIKALDKQKQSGENRGPVHSQRKRPSSKLVMFHVQTTGGEGVVKIMRNPALRTNIQEMSVYAYKGEKVKQALRRDGRLLNTIFKKTCVLSNTSTEVTTEMSNLVDDLGGKSFKIILLNKSSPPDSQPGSLDDAYMTQNESPRSDSDGNHDPPQQPGTTESVNDNNPKEKPKLNSDKAPRKILGEIPNSKMMRSQLSSQFDGLVKGMKTQKGSKKVSVQNLLHVEFGKNVQTCREVKTMKKLMHLSNSVCQVRINGRPEGSGFLLFNTFVLTNGHVVKNNLNEHTGQFNEKVTVHFSFEDLDPMEGGQESGAEVVEVAGFEHWHDGLGHEHDWALLRLGADQRLPDGLLTHFGFLPKCGGICIIGHPYGGVKQIDPCFIIQTENRNQVVERHYRENPGSVVVDGTDYNLQPGPIQLVTDQFFPLVAKWVEQKKQVVTYETCFYFGSSGSPVFDKHCNVVAMHTGGYAYHSSGVKCQSVIEFGHPLSVIIERIIFQIVERGKFDVLKKYLACSYSHQQSMMASLKKLVESRNLSAFKNAVNNPEVTNDESLWRFFEFLSQREEPVPMDTV